MRFVILLGLAASCCGFTSDVGGTQSVTSFGATAPSDTIHSIVRYKRDRRAIGQHNGVVEPTVRHKQESRLEDVSGIGFPSDRKKRTRRHQSRQQRVKRRHVHSRVKRVWSLFSGTSDSKKNQTQLPSKPITSASKEPKKPQVGRNPVTVAPTVNEKSNKEKEKHKTPLEDISPTKVGGTKEKEAFDDDGIYSDFASPKEEVKVVDEEKIIRIGGGMYHYEVKPQPQGKTSPTTYEYNIQIPPQEPFVWSPVIDMSNVMPDTEVVMPPTPYVVPPPAPPLPLSPRQLRPQRMSYPSMEPWWNWPVVPSYPAEDYFAPYSQQWMYEPNYPGIIVEPIYGYEMESKITEDGEPRNHDSEGEEKTTNNAKPSEGHNTNQGTNANLMGYSGGSYVDAGGIQPYGSYPFPSLWSYQPPREIQRSQLQSKPPKEPPRPAKVAKVPLVTVAHIQPK